MKSIGDAENTGLVSNIQKYSLHDGPGIRTTVFFKGCPLSCAWCHNPENMLHKPELMRGEARCIRCGQCFTACPRAGDSHRQEASPDGLPAPKLFPEDESCLACGACAQACPTGAKTIVGRWMAPSELLCEILADRIFYDDSKGGVTFSGGEPLLQHGFLDTMLKACQANEIHTTVDTCGYAPETHLRKIVPFTNLFLFDIKFIDDGKHREYTGVSNRQILHNLHTLGLIHQNIWIRIPVIPSVNDSVADLESLARFLEGMKAVRQVNLLPYHRTGVHKFTKMGQEYSLHHLPQPTKEYMEAVAEKFASLQLPVIVGG